MRAVRQEKICLFTEVQVSLKIQSSLGKSFRGFLIVNLFKKIIVNLYLKIVLKYHLKIFFCLDTGNISLLIQTFHEKNFSS